MSKYKSKRKFVMCAAKKTNGAQCMEAGTSIGTVNGKPRWVCPEHGGHHDRN